MVSPSSVLDSRFARVGISKMRKGAVVLRVALAISLVLGTAQAVRADDAETVRAQARDATAEYNMGHFKEALARFQAIYKATGKNALLFNIAQCQRQMGKLKDAAFSYRRFIELEPDNQRPRFHIPLEPRVQHLVQ